MIPTVAAQFIPKKVEKFFLEILRCKNDLWSKIVNQCRCLTYLQQVLFSDDDGSSTGNI